MTYSRRHLAARVTGGIETYCARWCVSLGCRKVSGRIDVNLSDMQDKSHHLSWEQRVAASSQGGAFSRKSLPCLVETEKDDEALRECGRVTRQEGECAQVTRSRVRDFQAEIKRKNSRGWSRSGVKSSFHLALIWYVVDFTLSSSLFRWDLCWRGFMFGLQNCLPIKWHNI